MIRSFLLLVYVICGWGGGAAAQLSIIPRPDSVRILEGSFTLTSATIIQAGARLQPAARFLQSFLQELPPVSAEGPSILLEIDSSGKGEAYVLKVTPELIRVTGGDEAGVFYGLQSLLQLAAQSPRIPACLIRDSPRFAYRGLHLDVSRNLFSIHFLKKYIDLMALYKLNTFHWHLTDDQGWRIEIKKYPELQRVAAWREETLVGHKRNLPHHFDGRRYGGYYTQQEVREVVAYAASRHVTVIPEIEMPGHASAALAAYPQLGCRGRDYRTATFWGVFDDVFCAGKDSVFTFLEDVLEEILPLFPSRYIHIGGDECPKVRWKACPHCQKRIQQNGLKNEHGLQSYFIRRMERFLNARGREIIGWDEILEGGLSPRAIVMSWRGETGGVEAARQEHRVIMTPESHMYFDYYQSLDPGEPVAAAWYTPLGKVYAYEPYPRELESEYHPYVIGVQANIWTEYMADTARVEYMAFPRVLALAEIAWSSPERKNYTDFLRRVRENEALLRKKKVNYFDHYEELNYSWENGALGLSSTLPGGQIFYTMDGREPSLNDHLYTRPVRVRGKSSLIKSRLFREGQAYGTTLEQEFRRHKAVYKSIHLKLLPDAPFHSQGGNALVNGLAGNGRYNDGEWTGFSGGSLEAVIDLGKKQPVSEVGINILKYHWQRMWEPEKLVFSVSEDGQNYLEVFRTSHFPENGINRIRGKIKKVRTRYIKVEAQNRGVVPAGEYGAGGKAWLLADEIYVK